MAKQKSLPQSVLRREDRKEVRVPHGLPEDTPSWRFSTADRDGPYAWPTDTAIKAEILDKLHEFDSMRWCEIEGRRHHSISIESLSSDAKSRLKEIQQDDVDEVFSFALDGKKRLICIRALHVAKMLWYDPDHSACPSSKKHT